MKKVYLDKREVTLCIGVFIRDTEVISAGATLSAMSAKLKNPEYQRYADEYDIHFIFSDDVPTVDFYTVPQVDLFAADGHGGFLGALGGVLDRDSRICHIDRDRNCFMLPEQAGQFLQNPGDWKSRRIPCQCVEMFRSVEEAKAKYEFLDSKEVLNSLTEQPE